MINPDEDDLTVIDLISRDQHDYLWKDTKEEM